MPAIKTKEAAPGRAAPNYFVTDTKTTGKGGFAGARYSVYRALRQAWGAVGGVNPDIALAVFVGMTLSASWTMTAVFVALGVAYR